MIRYQYQTDEFVAPSLNVTDEGDNWWYSVQKCGALIAFAASLALTQAQTASAIQVQQQHPEEIASKFYFEEDTWQNPLSPQVQQIFNKQPFIGTEEIASKFYFEEDSWQSKVSPLQAFTPQPFIGSDELSVSAATAFYEDTWQPTALNPTVFARQPFTDPGEFLNSILADESFLLNPAWPAPIFSRQPFNATDDFVGPAAFALYDDTWQNPTQQAGAKYLWSSPIREEDGMHFVVPAPTGIHYIPVFRRRRR